MPSDRPASVDDTLSLAPLRDFFRKYRSYLTVGFIGIILFGILLVALLLPSRIKEINLSRDAPGFPNSIERIPFTIRKLNFNFL